MTKASVAAKLPTADRPERDHLLDLVAEHKKRKYEPLHLAVHFPHPRHKKDICLFEVIGGFGDGQIDPRGAIFEVEFSSNPNFPMPGNKRLRLFLTSPEELREAVRADWPSSRPLRQAVAAGLADVIFKDKIGGALLGLLQ